jgi:hypothetical protein
MSNEHRTYPMAKNIPNGVEMYVTYTKALSSEAFFFFFSGVLFSQNG